MTRLRRTPRRRSREAALQVLYALDLGRRRGRPAPVAQEIFESAGEHFELPEGARAFAKDLVLGVAEHREELDALLSRHASHWRLDRMAAVDRNVLRIAAFELRFTDTPAPVVLDEAIELARRFGGERSPAFVNGVLDAVARALAEPQ